MVAFSSVSSWRSSGKPWRHTQPMALPASLLPTELPYARGLSAAAEAFSGRAAADVRLLVPSWLSRSLVEMAEEEARG